MNKMKLEYVPIEKIEVNWDFRSEPRDEETQGEISKSIKQVGLVQLIKVRPKGKKYEVVAGRGRLKILKEMGEKKIPVIIEDLTDDNAKLQSIVENRQRQNLTPMELAKAFEKILTTGTMVKIRGGGRYKGYKELSDLTGISESRVSQIMSLVEAPAPVKQKIATAVKNKQISEDVAIEILSSTKNKPEIRDKALDKAIKMGINKDKIGGRTARKLVKQEQDYSDWEDAFKSMKSAGIIDEEGARKKTPDDYVCDLISKLTELYWWLEPKIVKHLSQGQIDDLKKQLLDLKIDKLDPFLEELELNSL